MEDIPVIESIIHTENPEYFLLGSSYCIFIFENMKLIEIYKPDFTVDGIYFTDQNDHKAIGHLYSYQFEQDFNVGFEFDLNTNEIKVNNNLKYEQIGPFEFVQVREKKQKIT